MSHTTMPAAIDALLVMFRALPECALPVVVFDGHPGSTQPDRFVTVGGLAEPTEHGDLSWAEVGAGAIEEDYVVHVHIWSFIGGDAGDATGAGDAQKVARDAAWTIFFAIHDALRADKTLALGGNVPLVRIAAATHPSLTQTPPDQTAAGRFAQLDFTVRCIARI